ncbi:MAG: hypothetical protein QE487_12125 [Fluviicola sp.]|nr:hypothetical protein [Fluviicola sp.]
MNRLVCYWLLMLTLFGCGVNKLKPQELFLAPDSSNDKIYILSAFPKHADSSSLYLSVLLVKHSDENKRQLTSFVSIYDRSGLYALSLSDFIDTLLLLNENQLPILLKPGNLGDRNSSFVFSIDRNSIGINLDLAENEEDDYKLQFPTQKPFKTKAIGTEFQLHAIEPISSEITSWDNEIVAEPSTLMLHTLDNGTSLFDSQSTGNYCWLDCSIDGTNYSLFFQYDSLGKITPIYSSFPEGAPHSIEPNSIFETLKQPENQASSTFTMKFTTENGFDNVTIQLAPKEQNRILSKNTFSVRAVDILIKNRLAGTGILYIL